MIDHLSVSQINTFSRCELQCYFRYIEGLKVPVKSSAIKGKAVHCGLECIYTSKQREGRYYPDAVTDLVSESIEFADKIEEVIWDEPKNKVKDGAVDLINVYIENKHPDVVQQKDIEAVEMKLDTELFTETGEEIKIVGYADLILKNKVVDFKTRTKKPTSITTDIKFQTAFYTSVTQKDEIELQYLISTKKPQIVILNTSSNNNLKTITREVFISAFKRISQSIKTGNFLPTGLFHPWACGYCGYGDKGYCKFST